MRFHSRPLESAEHYFYHNFSNKFFLWIQCTLTYRAKAVPTKRPRDITGTEFCCFPLTETFSFTIQYVMTSCICQVKCCTKYSQHAAKLGVFAQNCWAIAFGNWSALTGQPLHLCLSLFLSLFSVPVEPVVHQMVLVCASLQWYHCFRFSWRVWVDDCVCAL